MHNPNELPILFSTPMVQVTLAGRKTMTRRMRGLDRINENPDDYEFYAIGKETAVKTGKESIVAKFKHKHGYFTSVKLPWWIDNLLWVRETLHQEGELYLCYDADDTHIDEDLATIPPDFPRIDKNGHYKFCNIANIFMPKWAARIWLKVKSVRVERLQDISEADAISEGIEPAADGWKNYMPELIKKTDFCWPTAYHSFQSLWEEINGSESWENNCWVWVIEFEVLSTTGKPENIQ